MLKILTIGSLVGIMILLCSICWGAILPAPSLIELKLNPNKFENEKIFLMGFFVDTPEGFFLFPYEIDAQLANSSEAVRIYFTSSIEKEKFDSCIGSYVSLVGKFKKIDRIGYGITDLDIIRTHSGDRLDDSALCWISKSWKEEVEHDRNLGKRLQLDYE